MNVADCACHFAGSVLLQTRGPAQARTWVGKADYYNVGKKEPALPAVCLKEVSRHPGSQKLLVAHIELYIPVMASCK
jgi:hypothetical protein